MKQTKKNYGKKPTTTVSKQSTNGNKGNALRNRYTEKFIRPTEFPARSGRMTYIRKDYHHIIYLSSVMEPCPYQATLTMF